jgi:hypothetical protein
MLLLPTICKFHSNEMLSSLLNNSSLDISPVVLPVTESDTGEFALPDATFCIEV